MDWRMECVRMRSLLERRFVRLTSLMVSTSREEGVSVGLRGPGCKKLMTGRESRKSRTCHRSWTTE